MIRMEEIRFEDEVAYGSPFSWQCLGPFLLSHCVDPFISIPIEIIIFKKILGINKFVLQIRLAYSSKKSILGIHFYFLHKYKALERLLSSALHNFGVNLGF